MKYAYLTVLKVEGGRMFCKCRCGTKKWFTKRNVVRGLSRSCGCYQKERVRLAHTTHGFSHKSSYRTYYDMMKRCHNPMSKDYIDYGLKGITVCDSWKESFLNFYNDMGERPDGMTLDRIDNTKGYSPDNCRWADIYTQRNNRSDNRFVQYKGVTLTIGQLARQEGIEYDLLYGRIVNGVPIERALSTPARRRKRGLKR